MKATGIVRRIDDLGRVVIPKETRRALDMAAGDSVEIFVSDKGIVLRKYVPGCVLCDSVKDLHVLEGKKICLECRIKIGRTLGR